MTLDEEDREFGPVIMDDEGRAHRVRESEARSALGGAGGALIAMIAWDFGAHDWVTFDPHAMPIYLPPLLRESVRWSGLAIGSAIFVTAWREQHWNVGDGARELNGREFVPGRKPGWRQ